MLYARLWPPSLLFCCVHLLLGPVQPVELPFEVFVLSQLGLQRLVIRGPANVLVVKNMEPPIFLASPQTGRSQRKGLMGTTARRAPSAGQRCDGGERRRSSFLSRYGLILAPSDADRNGNLFSAPSESQPSRRLMSPRSPYASAPLIWQNPQNEKLLKPGCSMTPTPLRRVSASPSKASSGGTQDVHKQRLAPMAENKRLLAEALPLHYKTIIPHGKAHGGREPNPLPELHPLWESREVGEFPQVEVWCCPWKLFLCTQNTQGRVPTHRQQMNLRHPFCQIHLSFTVPRTRQSRRQNSVSLEC